MTSTPSRSVKALSIACVLAITFSIAWGIKYVVIAITPSTNYTIFIKHESPQSQFALFWAPTWMRWEYLSPEARNVPFAKKIGCRPGDILETHQNRFYCNGHYLAIAKPHSNSGKPLTQFIWNGTVPDNAYFMVGTHPDSFDSRYYGFIPSNHIISYLKEIL